MRIHIQNQKDDLLPEIDVEIWQEAAARAGDAGIGHEISIGNTTEELSVGLREAEALVTTSRIVMRSLPLHAPQLKLIFCTNAGMNLLAGADLPKDVVVLNNSGAHSDKAGEYGAMAVLMLANLLPRFITQQKHETWSRHLARGVAGRWATVIGLGSLGGGVAKRLRWFGMHVMGVRTRAEPHPDCDQVITTAEVEQMLPQTEFLVLACPLTTQTNGLLNRSRIRQLPKGAGIVNIGRGELIEQDALLDALDDGHLSGTVLDVFCPRASSNRSSPLAYPKSSHDASYVSCGPNNLSSLQPEHLLREPSSVAGTPQHAERG